MWEHLGKFKSNKKIWNNIIYFYCIDNVFLFGRIFYNNIHQLVFNLWFVYKFEDTILEYDNLLTIVFQEVASGDIFPTPSYECQKNQSLQRWRPTLECRGQNLMRD